MLAPIVDRSRLSRSPSGFWAEPFVDVLSCARGAQLLDKTVYIHAVFPPDPTNACGRSGTLCHEPLS
jgi:hypothetical protein